MVLANAFRLDIMKTNNHNVESAIIHVKHVLETMSWSVLIVRRTE
jgi:hypothetical protein